MRDPARHRQHRDIHFEEEMSKTHDEPCGTPDELRQYFTLQPYGCVAANATFRPDIEASRAATT